MDVLLSALHEYFVFEGDDVEKYVIVPPNRGSRQVRSWIALQESCVENIFERNPITTDLNQLMVYFVNKPYCIDNSFILQN